jgi:hypothetical protein
LGICYYLVEKPFQNFGLQENGGLKYKKIIVRNYKMDAVCTLGEEKKRKKKKKKRRRTHSKDWENLVSKLMGTER